MTELLTAAQMRSLEMAAIESGQVSGLELMERAGRGVVQAVLEEWPELATTSHRAVVLCGPGNNGGDGFVIARLLKDLGWEVEVFLLGDPEKLPPDARRNFLRWGEIGEVAPLTEAAFRAPHPVYGRDMASIYVDAIFGTGLTRPVGGAALDVLTHMSGRNGDDYVPRTVAVDAPSGLCLDSGRVLGDRPTDGQGPRGRAAMAALTVAFDSPKVGHFLAEGPQVCGKLVVKDIGLADWRATQVAPGQGGRAPHGGGGGRVMRPAETTLVCRRPIVDDRRYRHDDARWEAVSKAGHGAHKYSFGHALVLSGGFGKSGAARLAARGALRIGAGLVTLGVPGSAQMEVACQITALMMTRVEDADGLAAVLEDPRITALCLGPGLGGARARDLVPVALGGGAGGGLQTHPTRGVVLDADALTAFRDAPEALFQLLHGRCVLTPHGGEFARLFPDLAKRLAEAPLTGPAYSKVYACRAAAARAGCVVLFKGPDTVIAAPDGRCAVHAAVYDRAAPWLATAGAGDVLAGMIAGLLARGLAPMQAAELATWLHVEAARRAGPGLIAEDLPDILPDVLRALEAEQG